MQRISGLTVLAVVASLLTVAPVTFFTATAANAAYATGGEGKYNGAIDWFQWGEAGDPIPADGTTEVNTRTVAGGELVTTCTIMPPQGQLQVYRPGTYTGDGLDDLYNIGGTGNANQLISGIRTDPTGSRANFDFECSVTFNGTPVPLAGLVMADAEASWTAQGEYVQATIPAGAEWRLIDRYRSPECGLEGGVVRTGQTLRFTGIEQRICETYPTAVAFMENASSASIELQGGGWSAIALGVVLFTDFGDAPESYGSAGSLFSPTFSGATVPEGTSTIFSSDLSAEGNASPRLGETITSEASPLFSADADADVDDAISPPGTINVIPGNTYTLSDVSCNGTGYVAGWLDWNGNGSFDAGERSTVVACESGAVDLSWVVPADATNSLGDDKAFLRLRIADNEAALQSPVGITTTGEVEDYSLNIALPSLSITKSSDAVRGSRPGDTVTYTVTATNTGESDFTNEYPAVVFDDLSGVLDDADYNRDSVASRPGAVSYVEPLVSWTGALPAGETVQLTYTTTLKAGGDGVVRNIAWVPEDAENPKTPVCDPRAEDGTDPETGEPCAKNEFELPRLTIDKSADRTELPAVGESVEYTVTVTNEGPGDYTADAPATFTDDLTDVIDAATFNNDATASVGEASYDAPTLSWEGALAAGESATVTYTVTYSGEGDQNLRNLACVPESQTAPGALSCDSVQIPGADLTQWKQVEATDTPAVAGTVLTYTLFFRNDGEAAAAVDAIDDLTHVTDDADVTVEPSSDDLTVSRDGNRIAVTGSVPSGETATVTYQVTVKGDGDRGDDIAANFLMTNDLEDPPTVPETPECVPTEEQRPDCTATPIAAVTYAKSVEASTNPIGEGTVLTYTVTVENTGAATAPVSREDVLTDVLDDTELTSDPVSDIDSVTVTDVTDGRFEIGGELAAGETATITYNATVKAEALRGHNSADNFLVTPGETPPEECAVGSLECTITPLPNVGVVKTVNPETGASVQEDQEVTYTLNFTNSGNAVGAVDYTDDLAGVLDDADLTGAPTAENAALDVTDGTDGTVRVTGTLEPGRTVAVTYTVTVKPDGERGDNQLRNVVVKTGEEPPEECLPGECTEHPVGELDDWKTVDPASGTTVKPGQVVTYTLHFENTGRADKEFTREDVLTQVIDDADVTGQPVASSDALTVTEIADGRFRVSGTLTPGQVETVTYQVTVKPDGERGDDRLGNFLVESGEEPPTECVPADGVRPDCTINHVSDVTVAKSSDPESGTKVNPGEDVTYTLTFTNTSTNTKADPVAVDYTDYMVDVLDDATLTDGPAVSNGNLQAVAEGDTIRITGAVPTGETYTVTYTVTVKAYDEQGNHGLGNVVAVTGEEPVCAPGSSLCTSHDVPTPPSENLAVTGGAISATVITAAVLLLLAGGVLVYTSRRRRAVAGARDDQAVAFDDLM